MNRFASQVARVLAAAAVAKTFADDGRGITVDETQFPEPGPAPQAAIARKAARSKQEADSAARQFQVGWIPHTIDCDQKTPLSPRQTFAANKPHRSKSGKRKKK